MSTPSEHGYLGYYAGFISRLVAFTIDLVITMFSIVAVSWFISVTATVFQLSATWDFLVSKVPQLANVVPMIINPVVGSVLAIGYIFLYNALFVTILGQTPGKLLIGVRVLTVNGRSVPFWRSSLRVAAYLISAIVFFMGFLWVLVDDRRQAWHDKIAGTYVVYAWEARPDERFLVEFFARMRSMVASRSLRSK
jgi:uncharacterized RDD family membrane protein YckC